MNDVSDKVVILTLILTIAVSLGGATMILTKLSTISGISQVTGLASDGYVKISINETIRLNVTVDTIDFGTCDLSSIPLGTSQSINSEWSTADIATNTDITCNSTTLPDNLTIANTGNAYFNLTVESSQTGPDLLTSGSSVFALRATEIDSSCTGIGGTIYDTYQDITATGTEYQLCTNMSYGTPNPIVAVWANFTIPDDASTSGSEVQATLTFNANPLG